MIRFKQRQGLTVKYLPLRTTERQSIDSETTGGDDTFRSLEKLPLNSTIVYCTIFVVVFHFLIDLLHYIRDTSEIITKL